ncbi:hypothetical protein U9M48_041136 [Paspalum notatum var. saurae]|uniref:Uncharacterized protein n=1 Tax=Paspalum notatum var. saurae TaxID=547442 RepID=A0AAQ3XD14_PASNO
MAAFRLCSCSSTLVSLERGLEGRLADLRCRETLFWISVLNKVPTPLSRSTMSSSNPCNCSASQTTLFFWKDLETSDHLLELGIASCFDSRCSVDSRIDTAISLASAISLITLHPSISELLRLLGCTCVALNLGLKSRVLSSFESQSHPLDSGLELHKALLHGVAEVE